MKKHIFTIAFALFFANFLSAQSAGLPLKPGFTIGTSYSGLMSTSTAAPQDPNGPTLTVFDPRDPVGSSAPFAANWAGAASNGYHPTNCVASNTGELHGIALEEYTLAAPDIYVASCGVVSYFSTGSVYPMGGATSTSAGGEVFLLDGTTGALSVIDTVPSQRFVNSGGNNRYTGVGQIAFNHHNRVLYASGFDDGKIYVMDVDGGGVQAALTFDPGASLPTPIADDNSKVFTQEVRRVFGVGYNAVEKRLYYALPDTTTAIGTYKTNIYSIAVDATTGGPIGAPEFEVNVVGGFSNSTKDAYCADITFSHAGTEMLLGFMSMRFRDEEVARSAHNSATVKLGGSTRSWSQDREYWAGAHFNGYNNSGGVDFGFNNYGVNDGGNNFEDAVVLMGDYLNGGTVYGLQFQDKNGAAGSNVPSSYLVDLDNTTTNQDKRFIGDVEVYPGYPDFGDHADSGAGTGAGNTETTLDSDGAYHIIDPDLTIGKIVDIDADGQQTTFATGDDQDGIDDEDGYSGASYTAGQETCFDVTVNNNTGQDAYFYSFFDWNGDGDFGDANEIVIDTVPNGATSVNVCVTPPVGTPSSVVMIRFRITTEDLSARSGGYELWEGGAADGEVEDYVTKVILPIELLSFNGVYDAEIQVVNLTWTTAMEMDVSKYELMRSYDRENFEVFWTKESIEDSYEVMTYYATDEDIRVGTTIYYQLKVTNTDGTYEYSDVVSVKTGNDEATIQMFPNPATDLINITVDDSGVIEVININGTVVLTQSVQKGNNQVGLEQLAVGVYIVKYHTESSNALIVKRIIKR